MKRVNGFIDLESIIDIGSYSKLKSNDPYYGLYKISKNKDIDIIKVKLDNKQFSFTFRYNNDLYYFKYDGYSKPYSEVLMEELAKLVGIDNLNYDLATFFGSKGVISKNYKGDDIKRCINGKELLSYLLNDKNDNPISIKRDLDSIDNNSLLKIWMALEFRYKDKETVKLLMDEIVKRFIFDTLVGNVDCNLTNLEILEYFNGEVSLSPKYDNARAMFYKRPNRIIPITCVDGSEKRLNEVVDRFISISDSEYIEFLYECINALDYKSLLYIIDKVEDKISAKIPMDVKMYYFACFKNYYSYFDKVIRIRKL